MSFITAIGKKIITPSAKRAVKFAHITDPVQRQVAQDVSLGAENLTRLVKEVSPEQIAEIQKIFKPFERYGFSQGDVKYLIKQHPDLVQNLELIADDKLINALLKRKDLVKDGILGCVTKENKKAFIQLLRDKNINDEEFKIIANLITEENAPILKQLLKDKTFDSKILADVPTTHLKRDNVDVLRAIAAKGNVKTQEMLYIMASTNKSNSDIALKLLEKSGENPEGLNMLLHQVYAYEGMSKEGLQAFELRKRFLTELLENSNFKLGKNEMENFNISEVLSVIKSENYEVAQLALLKRNANLNQLSDFLKDVTSENQEIAKRILSFASNDTKLPDIKHLNPEIATRYLDEIAKISNPEAQSLYIGNIDSLKIREENIDEILKIIRTTKPENAKHASAIITSMNCSGKSIKEIESIVNIIEQSGRQLNDNTISNLVVLSGIKEIPVAQFIERIVKNKAISDRELGFLTEKYISIAQKVKSQGFYLPHQIEDDLRLGKITETEINNTCEKLMAEFEQKQAATIEKLPDLLEKLYQNKSLNSHQVENIFSQLSMNNISLVEKYALNSNIAKIDLCSFEPKYIQELESLLKTDIPSYYQKEFLPVLKLQENGGQKRLEVLQDLMKREKTPSAKTIAEVVEKVDKKTLQYIDDIMARKDLTPKQVLFALDHIQCGDNVEGIMKLIKDTSLKGKYFEQVFEESAYKMYEQYPELAKKVLDLNVPLQVMNPKGSFGNNFVAITDVIGEKKLTNMLKGLERARDKYGIVPKDLYLSGVASANDLFIVLKQSDNNLLYKFDKKTGNLVTINQGEKTIHLKSGTQVYDSVSSELIANNAPAKPYRISSITEGKNGKTFGTVYTESAIKGQYDIYHTMPDGSRIRIGHAQVTPNGAKHVRRTLSSVDGSKTYTAFREDKAGNSSLHSVITDKAGKQVSEVTRTFKVVSKNHFVSTVNGKSYDIVFTDKKVVVTKLDSMGKKTAEKVEYAIADVPVETANKIAGDLENLPDNKAYKLATSIFKKYGIESRTIDRSCVDMLKRLPGDEWFAMSKSCEFVMPQSFMPENAFYAGNSIFMSKELNNNLGVFAHELGHAKFHVLDLIKDKELMKIYNAEKRVYTAKFPESRIESIEYFLANNDAGKRGLNEACAETNLMTDTIQTWDQLQDRTIFLEQYFPNTIAHIRQRYSVLV